MKLTDRVALVVGGADGVGRASCVCMAQDGAKIAVGDVNAERGQETVDQVQKLGGEAFFVRADVMDQACIADAVKQTVDRFGKLDIAVTTAGRVFTGEDAWVKNIDMFLRGTYYTNKYAIEQMVQNGGGSVINVSSIAGVTGSAGKTVDDSGYGSAKHGVVGLTRALALRYAKNNIRVNAICPGFLKTELTRFQWGNEEFDKTYIANQGVPMNRWGRPEEIGTVVCFLASDDASFITGQPIIVDGGFMAR
jgi:NAD(P)-dependent dehydrogenase (short-subunit alcohol dehydrogenase family)